MVLNSFVQQVKTVVTIRDSSEAKRYQSKLTLFIIEAAASLSFTDVNSGVKFVSRLDL